MIIDVDLIDFDSDDLIEELESRGYTVLPSSSEPSSKNIPPISYSSYEESTNAIKSILQSRCYDNTFIRHMLTSIADMPMCSSVDAVMDKLKTMCL